MLYKGKDLYIPGDISKSIQHTFEWINDFLKFLYSYLLAH